jgi:hypothetical protein
MKGTTPPLPQLPSWHSERQIYFFSTGTMKTACISSYWKVTSVANVAKIYAIPPKRLKLE